MLAWREITSWGLDDMTSQPLAYFVCGVAAAGATWELLNSVHQHAAHSH